MRFEVIFAASAEADLRHIFDFVQAQSGEFRARSVVTALYAYCLGFDRFPERGIRRDDLRPGLRTVGFRRQATVAFAVEGGRVTILRVLLRGRDVQEALADPDSA